MSQLMLEMINVNFIITNCMINVSSGPQLRQKVHSLFRIGALACKSNGGGHSQEGEFQKDACVHVQRPNGGSKPKK